MRQNVLRLAVAFGVATGLLGFVQTVAYAAGDVNDRIGTNHSEPQR